ncbi:MAG: exopolysaccharide Pel transporter PelG [Planctomycetota bacterium]
MAGIGFELRGAVAPDAGIVDRLRAWTAAGLISSGPWFATVAVLLYLHLAAPFMARTEEYQLFRGIVTYSFAFSLLLVGLVQMPITRKLADQMWLRQHDRVLPGFVATLAATACVQVPVGAWFVSLLGVGRGAGLLAVALYVVCTWTWVALVWLGATRDYASVLRAYAMGGGATVGATIVPALLRTLTGDPEGRFLLDGLGGLLLVFTLGQATTLLLLCAAIARGVRPSDRRGPEALEGVARFGALLLLGALYNVGMWADKFVFWVVDGVTLVGPLRSHPLYDSCSFLAYATVVPALALHLVRTETGFYERYRDFYDSISGGGTLREVRAARDRMLATLRGSVVRLVRVQAWFSAAAIALAPEVLQRLGMPPAAVPVFRVLAVGAYFHVLFLLTLLVLLYFDRRATALRAVATFAALNTILPLGAALGDPGAYGVGYTLAAIGGLVVGFLGLQRDLARLEYLTFSGELSRLPQAEAPGVEGGCPASSPSHA